MSVFSFLRHVGRRHKESQRAKGAKKQRRGGERLRVEALEKRELLNNDTPFIKSVSPPDGGGSSSALPALTIQFSETMDTTSTTAASSITNPANYILVAADGTLLSIQSATASSNPTGNTNDTVTLVYNNGVDLPVNQYTLFVRGDQIKDVNDGRTLSDPGQLIVANSNRNNVSTAALTGNGVIGALSDYALPSVSPPSPPTVATPVAVQMADLTGDGIPDLVVVNAGTNQVDIFQGRSTSAGGGFSQSPDLILSLAAGAAPRAGSLVVADLHDNLNTAPATNRLLDIAVADAGTHDVTVFLNTRTAPGTLSFGTGTTYAASATSAAVAPAALVAADINSDGFLDLATANSAAPTDLSSPADSVNDYSVSVMMNAAATAPATFPAARVSSFRVGDVTPSGVSAPTGIAAGILSSSGRPDLVVSGGNGNLGYLQNNTTTGNATATFATVQLLSTGAGVTTSSVTLGKLDAGNTLDIAAVANVSGGQVLMFTNNGAASPAFTPLAAVNNIGANPTGVTLADVDGNGQNDILVVNNNASGTATVLLSTGSGATVSFSTPISYAVDSRPQGLAVADTNGDGRIDLLATANNSSSTVSFLASTGTIVSGNVTDASNANPIVITTTAANLPRVGSLVTISGVLGNGGANGTFQVSAVSGNTFTLAGATASGGYTSGGTWVQIPSIGTITGATNPASPNPIVITSNNTLTNGSFVTIRGVGGNTNANGTFQVSSVNAAQFTLVNSTGNGNYTGGGIWISPDDLFRVSSDLPIPGSSPTPDAVAVGDLNSDGLPDYVVANRGSSSNGGNTITVILSGGLDTVTGQPLYRAPFTLSLAGGGSTPVGVAIGDLNNDGHPDIVVADQTSSFGNGNVTVLTYTGSGTLFNATTYTPSSVPDSAIGDLPTGIALGDFNGDGFLDLAISHNRTGGGHGGFNSQGVTIVLNAGAPTGSSTPFAGQTGTEAAGNNIAASAVAVADLDHDGHLDFVVAKNSAPGQVVVFYGNGAVGAPLAFANGGTFATSVTNPTALVLADVNLDGFLDVVVASSSTSATTGGIAVLLNQGGTTFGTPVVTSVLPGTGLSSLAVTQANEFARSGTITDASNANPLVITSANHGLSVGQVVTIRGVQGNGAANGVFNISAVTANTFTLEGASGSGAYTGGGIWYIPDVFPDIIVGALSGGGGSTTNNVFRLLGNGDGTFQAPTGYLAGGTGSPTLPSSFVATTPGPLVHATTFTSGGTIVRTDFVSNGNFEMLDLSGERGNLNGWYTYDLPSDPGSEGQWRPQTGTTSPLSGVTVPTPLGSYQAMLDEANEQPFSGNNNPNPDISYAGSHALYQDIVIPAIPPGTTTVTLTYNLYINNFATSGSGGSSIPLYASPGNLNFNDPADNQQVRIDIVDPTNPNQNRNNPTANFLDVTTASGVLQNLFITAQGQVGFDPTQATQTLLNQTVNLTSFANSVTQTFLRLRIATVNNRGKLIVGIDNVHITAQFNDNTPPALTGLAMRNPGFTVASSPIPHTTDTTIVGRVSDNGSINNLAYVAFDVNNDGIFNGLEDFRLTRTATSWDALGNFSFTVPGLATGLHTIGVQVADKANNLTTTTITFFLENNSLTGWTAYGPNGIDVTNQSNVDYDAVSGRVTAVVTDPRDLSGNTYYVGSANGGVWKTSDGGASWKPTMDFLTDGAGNPLAAPIGALAISGLSGAITGASNTNPIVITTSAAALPSVGSFVRISGVGGNLAANATFQVSAVNGNTFTLAGSAGNGNYTNGGIWSEIPAPGAHVVLYAATGVADIAFDSRAGVGIFKSIDDGLTWTLAGDSAIVFGGANAARISKIVIDPNDSNTVYVAVASGGASGPGVYKLTNNGTQWVNTMTAATMGFAALGLAANTPLASVTDLVMDPFQPGRLFVGMGNIGLVTAAGNTQTAGLWFSANGGGSWSQPVGGAQALVNGSFINVPNSTLPNGRSSNNIGRVTVAISPARVGDEASVYILIGTPPGNNTPPNVNLGGFFGLYKTSNNFQNFTKVMLKQDISGGGTHNFVNINVFGNDASYVGAMAVDPTNANVVYIGGSSLWGNSSTNHALIRVDTGNMRDASYVQNGAIPNDGDDISKYSSAQNRAFFYDNVGPTPTQTDPYTGEGVYWYDIIEQANNRTRNFTYLPPEIHALAFDAQGRLLIGTEGGLWRAVTKGYGYDFTSGGSGILRSGGGGGGFSAPGTTITSINGNLQISDLTSVAIDPTSRNVLYTTQAGTGSARSAAPLEWVSMGLTGPGNLSIPTAGLVRAAEPAPGSPDGTPTILYRVWRYANNAALVPEVSIDGGETWSSTTGIPLANNPAGMFPPFALNPVKVVSGSAFVDQALFGTGLVFVANTSGHVWDSVPAGAALTSPPTQLSTTGGLLTALAIGPTPPGVTTGSTVFYAGDNLGEVFVTFASGSDGTTNGWFLRNTGLPAVKVNGITIDPNNSSIAYVMLAASGSNSVWRTTNGGQNWTNISTGLPAVPAYAMAIDPRTTGGFANGHLYLATEVGVFVSTNLGAAWQRLGAGLPNVPVVDLQFNQAQETLAAATQGRGAFTISTDLIGPQVTGISSTLGVVTSVTIDGVATPVPPSALVTLTFNEPISPATLTTSALSLVGPGGAIPSASLTIYNLHPQTSDPLFDQVFAIAFPGASTPGSYTLTLQPTVTDTVGNLLDQNQNGTNGQTPQDVYTGHFLFQTSVPNTAPVLNNTTATFPTPINENPVTNPGVDLATFTASLNIVDPDVGAVRGIAVTSFDNTNGTWQYSTDSGTTWTNIPTIPTNNAFLLQGVATNFIRFAPALNYFGTATFTYQAWDLTTGLNPVNGGDALLGTNVPSGGTTAFSTQQGTATVTVIQVNQPPTFTIAANPPTTLEDAGAQTVNNFATNMSVGPANETGQNLLGFTVTQTGGSLTFTQTPSISLSGTLTYQAAPDSNGTATFNVTLRDDGGTANGGRDTSTPARTFTITVTAVNDVPSFTKGPDVTVLEDSGAYNNPWATSLSKGPADESGQTLNFIVVSNSNTPLFAAGPSVDAAGNLSFTPATNANGSAAIVIKIHDDGGTTNGGVDTSATQTFTINVTAVNDVPSFTKGANVTVLEDSGAYNNPWATSLSRGPADESAQTLNFILDSNSNAALFAVAPSVDATGRLSFTPAANANGTATVGFRIHDNGGTANGGSDTSAAQTFTITVTAVNDAPSFTKGPDVTVLEDSAAYNAPWATGLSAGPPDESGQALNFIVVSNSNPALFAAGPSVDAAGNLSFTPAANANGSATIAIQLHDNGGTANGGADTSAPQIFTISVTAVNDPPTFTLPASTSSNEDAGLVMVPGFVTNMSAGPPNEAGQSLANFTLTLTGTTGGLTFSTTPTLNASTGTLTYQAAPNSNGTATFSVTLSDNGSGQSPDVNTSVPQTFIISVVPVNDPPSFVVGLNVTAANNLGQQTLFLWATRVAAGPPDEAGQGLGFVVVGNSNPSLFAVQPAIAPDGTLTFTPLAGTAGTASITVELQDSGGTANGGVNTSAPQTFTITTVPANQPPTYTVSGGNVTAGQDAGPVSIPGFATNIVPGPAALPGLVVDFVVSTDNPALFAAGPAIDPNGTLTFTPSRLAGTAIVTVQGHNNGGTANTGTDLGPPVQFTITIGGSSLSGTPNEVWVAQTYINLLGRPVKPADLNFWTDQLEADVPRLTNATAIMNSDEYAIRYIIGLYGTLLHKTPAPDDPGIQLQYLRQGHTFEELKAVFLSSDAYVSLHGAAGNPAAWVEAVFQDILGHPAGLAGQQFWGDYLQTHSLFDTALAIVTSLEAYGGLVRQWYVTLLGRAPDASASFWFNALVGGARDQDVVAAIISSPEYFTRPKSQWNIAGLQAWVSQTYLDTLGRKVDPNGLGFWVGTIEGGASRIDIMQQIVHSGEFLAHQVQVTYQQLLHRPAGSGDMGFALQVLGNGGTFEQLKAILMGSAEYYFGRGDGTDFGFLAAVLSDALSSTPALVQGSVPFWGNALAVASRTDVALQILTDPNAEQALVENLYHSLLQRPGGGGPAFWAGQIQAGMRDEDVIARFVASREYYTRVSS